MDEIVINGGEILNGRILISGAKNAALPALAAAIMAPGVTALTNIPDVKDVRVMSELLTQLGAEIDRVTDTFRVNASDITSFEAPYNLVRTMRASVLLLGPLLSRLGKARVSLPGGCAIGNRPIDIHLKAFSKMGAEVELRHGMIDIRADKLTGGILVLDFPTVTGTENIMMAAVKADDVTEIHNAAMEPEIVNLADMLNSMGAEIEGAGTDRIVVHPVKSLNACEHRIIPDRIEAGTFAAAAAITAGCIQICNVIPGHLTSLLSKLDQAGVSIAVEKDRILVQGVPGPKAVDIQTAVYPGYPTDLQAQFMALMCLADGESVITETIFENRFMHVAELIRMGADITIRGRAAIVRGVDNLLGSEVMATDLRASASLVLAGLAAQGRTRVLRVYHLDRGYENLVGKMQSMGADIQRIPGRKP
ncbi:UDP-N-acetylglucosamine 1-carboxyvinyltransferase [bacterium]|nr:UDP-N-acetylglucosamine 1-carboxyvinyltransferase [candidate division CSSED10-310 bacterium]